MKASFTKISIHLTTLHSCGAEHEEIISLDTNNDFTITLSSSDAFQLGIGGGVFSMPTGILTNIKVEGVVSKAEYTGIATIDNRGLVCLQCDENTLATRSDT